MRRDSSGHGCIQVTLSPEGIEAIAAAVVRRLIEGGMVQTSRSILNGKRGKVPSEYWGTSTAKPHDVMDKLETLKLPETGFLRLPEVLKFIPVHRTTWYEGIKAGRYPAGVKLTERCRAWHAEDIRTLINRLGNVEK